MTYLEDDLSYNGVAAKGEESVHYVIYPDTLFVENFICNLLFLIFLKKLFFPTVKGKKLFQAAVMIALCNTLALVLFFYAHPLFQIGALFPAAGLMVLYCLEIRDRRRMLFLLYQMVLWTFVLGGIFQALEQWVDTEINLLVISAALLLIIFGILEKILRIYKRQNDCMREVVLYWKERCCHVTGFADTGNHLMDPVSKKPVSIITLEAWHKLLKEDEEPMYRYIPYRSIGNPADLLKGIQIDYMAILEGEHSQIIEKPMIAITEQPFTGIFHYSILLHSDFF